MILQYKHSDSIPQYLVALFLFLSPIEAFLVFMNAGTLLKYYQIISIIIMMMILVASEKKLKLNNLILVLIVFLMYMSMSLLWTESIIRGAMVMRSCLLQVVFIVFAVQFDYDAKAFKYMQIAMILGGILLSFLVLFNGKTYADYSNRFSIYINDDNSIDPNNLGGLLVTSIALLFPMTVKGMLKNTFKWGGLLLLVVALLMTASRGAVLACVCAVFVCMLLQKNFKKKFKYILIIAIAVIALIFINRNSNVNFIGNLFERFQEGGGSNRVDIWEHSISAFVEKPILGSGLGASPNVIRRYYGVSIGSHNTFITFLLEGGIVLFALFVLLIFNVYKKLRGSLFYGVIACETASLVCSFFIDTYNKKIFWTPLLLCFIALKIKKDDGDLADGKEVK